MKKFNVLIILVLLTTIFSCSKHPKMKGLTMKDVFPKQNNTDSTFVFSIDTIEKIEESKNKYCKAIEDKNQFIRTSLNDLPVVLSSFFYCNGILYCPKAKNTINIVNNFRQDTVYFIHNDTSKLLSVFGLKKLLSKQFFNDKQDPEYADSPNKNVIMIEYRDLNEKSKSKLSSSLDTIALSYFNFIKSFKKKNIDSLKKIYPLQILLLEDFRKFDKNGNLIHPKPQPPISTIE